ncbi:MAG: 3-dehydroquinate synthase [Oscillospiraceae bacterium]|nr:3-dehydroquinate synthase [Oscillospiraceae bacterium]
MKKINLKHRLGAYDIYIGQNLIKELGGHIENLGLADKKSKFGIISDDIVYPLYGEAVRDSIERQGHAAKCFVFKSGEAQKNLSTLGDIYDFLCENRFDRGDFLVALGGGVVGDLTGFAAATYLRGIKFIQIPTTLLAQLDSSVGGKTGANLPSGKNLVGAFYQPQLVLCDTGALSSLPKHIYADGMAEAIKCACIKSTELFERLFGQGIGAEEIIYRCVKIKADVVEVDEFESGERAVLNFGHTIGHAIEKYYDFSRFSHGQSVAIGMAYAAKISHLLNLCNYDVVEKINNILNIYNLPTDTGEKLDNKVLVRICCGDKKSESDTIKFVLLENIGSYRFVKINKDEIEDILCKI